MMKPTRLDILFFVIVPVVCGILSVLTLPLMSSDSRWWGLVAIPSSVIFTAIGFIGLFVGFVIVSDWIGSSRCWKKLGAWLDKGAW